MRNVVLLGDVREKLKEIPDGVVQTCVTSPPYFGLRDYNVSGQIGLEPTPEAFIEQLVAVFREVRRVLRDDGTLWLNLGDSYANDAKWGGSSGGKHVTALHGDTGIGRGKKTTGLKPKDLIGIPWRVAFALQADGWYLRSDIIWAKGNVMPESVTDRPTKSHEYIFLLTKNERYFYDADAVREPHATASVARVGRTHHTPGHKWEEGPGDQTLANDLSRALHPNGRNRRSVWHINPKPYKGAHFATFPEDLPEVCIQAGTSEKGACSKCGAPYRRLLKQPNFKEAPKRGTCKSEGQMTSHGKGYLTSAGQAWQEWRDANPTTLLGWQPTCECPEYDPVPCIVLDPFSGSGTTLAVAKSLRRDYLGCELNPEYHKLIEERLRPAEEMEAERQGFDEMTSLPED